MTTLFPLKNAVAQPRPPQSFGADQREDRAPFAGPMEHAPSKHFVPTSHAPGRTPGQYRTRTSFGANGNATMSISQASPAQLANGQMRNGGMVAGPQPLDIAKSPPNPANKNTKHVPCKFFKQGACQAGQACPFLHSMDSTVDAAPCKYFTKGNCKFGAKCALAHILPDGRRVNRPNVNMGGAAGINGSALNLGGRVNPPAYHTQDSALANSILTQQNYLTESYSSQYPYMGQEEMAPIPDRYVPYHNIPSIETGLSSNPGSNYGSPADDSRLPISPVGYHLTALDAPLPASFDSNGISHIARYGAVAASVPSKFGMESPSPSLPPRTAQQSEAIKALRNAAYGSNLRTSSNVGSSPPAAPEEPPGQRTMHSQKVVRPGLLSASVPRATMSDDWDDHFTLEEDLLPTNLHDDVLTPQERMRRLSRPEQEFGAIRDQSSALRIPSANSSKVGSPLGSSPSRFSALFAKQREKREQENNATSPSAFGHVGSPLRESSIHQTSSPILQPANNRWASGEGMARLPSPPRTASMSMLSQQVQRMNLNRTDSAESHTKLPSGSIRYTTAPVGRYDRAVSSPGLVSTRIDEEQGDLVFSMDEENSKRGSMIWGSKSPNLGPLHDGSIRNISRDDRQNKLYPNGVESIFGVRP